MSDEDILEIDQRPDDRRQFERRHLMVDIRFDGGDATGVATTRDIGRGGLYMATEAELPQGTPLTMRIKVGDSDLTLQGTVAYTDPGHGVGVRFHDISEEIEDILLTEIPLTEN